MGARKFRTKFEELLHHEKIAVTEMNKAALSNFRSVHNAKMAERAEKDIEADWETYFTSRDRREQPYAAQCLNIYSEARKSGNKALEKETLASLLMIAPYLESKEKLTTKRFKEYKQNLRNTKKTRDAVLDAYKTNRSKELKKQFEKLNKVYEKMKSDLPKIQKNVAETLMTISDYKDGFKESLGSLYSRN